MNGVGGYGPNDLPCIETLRPLSERVGLPIEEDDRLCVGTPVPVLEQVLGDASSSGVVMSTHGEVMTVLLDCLRATGSRIEAAREDDEWLLGKGTAWLLEIDDTGRCVRLVHRAPVVLMPVPATPDAGRVSIQCRGDRGPLRL